MPTFSSRPRRGVRLRSLALMALPAEVVAAQAAFLRLKRPAPMPTFAAPAPLQRAQPTYEPRMETVH